MLSALRAEKRQTFIRYAGTGPWPNQATQPNLLYTQITLTSPFTTKTFPNFVFVKPGSTVLYNCKNTTKLQLTQTVMFYIVVAVEPN